MHHATQDALPPPELVRDVTARVPVETGGDWVPMAGGLTNLLWRVGALVVKLYVPTLATPLFPNDPLAEWSVLRHLSPFGLAPEPVDLITGSYGTALVYRFIDGPIGFGRVDDLARMLHRVHGTKPPVGLRRLASGSEALLSETEHLLSLLARPDPAVADLMSGVRRLTTVQSVAPRLIHSDPVAANVVAAITGPVLIDWQCPALGDPCEDLAMVLSPSMRLAYGGDASDAAQAEFLAAYPDRNAAARYVQIAPFHHLKMAAYALWSWENGRVASRAGFEAERDALAVSLS